MTHAQFKDSINHVLNNCDEFTDLVDSSTVLYTVIEDKSALIVTRSANDDNDNPEFVYKLAQLAAGLVSQIPCTAVLSMPTDSTVQLEIVSTV